MLLTHKCFECGFVGEVKVSGRKVKCPKCGTINDSWLDGEEPPERYRKRK